MVSRHVSKCRATKLDDDTLLFDGIATQRSTSTATTRPRPYRTQLCISRCEPLPFFRDVVPALLAPAISSTITRRQTNTVPATSTLHRRRRLLGSQHDEEDGEWEEDG